jgi:hypothetical protein
VDLAYAEGYSAVSYLMEQYGRDTLKELMNSYRKGVSTDEAFASAMNKSSLEFEREWEDWLKTKYSEEQKEFSVDESPVFEQTSPGRNISLYLALCALGFAPFFCLTTVAVGALVGILLKQGLRS